MLKLRDKYKKEVIPAMREKFGYTNDMAVPKVEKVVVNLGFGKRISGKSSKERDAIQKQVIEILAAITGQRPCLNPAKKSISSFHLRKGISIGAKVTLRKQRMYDFLEKLILLVFPRVRDFRGIPLTAFDQNGNLTYGFKESTPFPEVVAGKEKDILGLEVTIVTTAKNREEGIELLRLMGLPIKNPLAKASPKGEA